MVWGDPEGASYITCPGNRLLSEKGYWTYRVLKQITFMLISQVPILWQAVLGLATRSDLP